jgi:HEAT repeat protein
MGNDTATEPLCKVLAKDQSNPVRHHAAVALGKIGDPLAAEALVQAMKDKDPKVRKAAEKALKQIKVKKVTGKGRSKEAPDV